MMPSLPSAPSSTCLQLRSAWHRSAYPVLNTPQQVYLWLEIGVTAAEAVLQPVNLCLVLDRSGSMAGEKLQAVKEAATLIVNRLGPKDLLAVVAFDDIEPAELLLPAGPVQDREAIERRIGLLRERGGTHLSTGLRLGLSQLQPGAAAGGRVNGLILLTDGRTWEDSEDCLRLAEQARQANIPIHVLGMGVGAGSDWDPRFLEELARRSGGEWGMVEQPQDTAAAFEKILHALRHAAVTSLALTLRLAPGVTARSVWRVTPLISRLTHQEVSAHDVQLNLGELQADASQSLLAELLVAPQQAGQHRLAQAEVQYCLLSEDQTDCAFKELYDLTAEFSEQAGEYDARLMNLVERVVAHKLQTQALDEAAAGDIVHATQRLRAAATRLLELGETALALEAEQQADHLQQHGQVEPAAAQKMRFATRRLTQTET